jgi:hypothetical protein
LEKWEVKKLEEVGGQIAWRGEFGWNRSILRDKSNQIKVRAQRKRGESEIPFVYRFIKFGKSPSWS